MTAFDASSTQQTSSNQRQRYTGRFAPSPTGQLHLGSLTTAIASYCHIKSLQYTQTTTSTDCQTKWLLRIEDIDRQRCKPEFSEKILYDLSALGLHWDGDVIYQSQRIAIYNEVIHHQLQSFVYACDCSRKDLKGFAIYPGHCRHKSLNQNLHKLRVSLPDKQFSFLDGIQGQQIQNPQSSLGDMVIRRDINSQNMINYILAVSVDDKLQGITHIMRGLDILPMTSAQIAITKMLTFGSSGAMNLSNDCVDDSMCQKILSEDIYWYHLPLVVNEQGQKLSKQNLARPIDTSTEKNCSQLLATALQFLNQPDVDMDKPAMMLAQAIKQWDTGLVIRN